MRCSECVYGVRTGGNLFCAEYDFLVKCEDANGCESYEPIRKPQTNADRIRAMSDEEIEKWFWWMHKEMMLYTDSRHFLHDWLKQEATEGG